jgi:hypothetical protein
MALSIDDIADAAAVAIESATPDFEPQITYRLLPGDADIDESPVFPSPDITTRQFQTWPGDEIRFSSWNGNTANLWTTLNVAVRYHVALTVGGRSGKWLRLQKMKGTDILRITHQLNKQAGAWTSTTLRMIEEPVVSFDQVDEALWILTMTFPVNLDLADS